MAGIAYPDVFVADLARLGLEVVEFHAFADHHAYRAADARRLEARLLACGAVALVTTAKDAVKLAPLWASPAPLAYVGAQLQVAPGVTWAALAARAARPCP